MRLMKCLCVVAFAFVLIFMHGSDFEYRTGVCASSSMPVYSGECVSYADVVVGLNDVFGVHKAVPDVDVVSSITVGQFLELFCDYSRIILDTDDGFVYLLGDSDFLSQTYFDDFMGRLYEPLDAGEFCYLLDRVRAMRAFLSGHDVISGVDDYGELIYNYYREFYGLYATNSDAVAFWLDVMVSDSDNWGRLSNILHELAHEGSARLSSGFFDRSVDGIRWQVIWRNDVVYLHPYDLSLGGFVRLNFVESPCTLAMVLDDTISTDLQNTELFQNYVYDLNSITNTFGIYGIAEEFCAYMIDVRFNMLCSALGYHGGFFSDDEMLPYYFWVSLVCSYLSGLREFDYAAYVRVTSDDSLMGLFRSTYQYVTGFVDDIPVQTVDTRRCRAIRGWYESDFVQAGIQAYFC